MKIDITKIPVLYINMKKDVHKKEYIEAQLKRLGFKDVRRIDAVEDKDNGKVGLSKSQHKSLSQIPAPFIILEDDADPKHFEKEIEVPDNAHAVYLGNSQWGFMQSNSGFYLKYKPVKGMRHLSKIYNMLSSHAILYLDDEYVRMCQKTTRYCAEEYPMPMDVPFAMIQRFFNIYVLNKPMFVQKDYPGKMTAAPKYTTGKFTDYKKYKSPAEKPGVYYKDEII
jgi:hypothetical protein